MRGEQHVGGMRYQLSARRAEPSGQIHMPRGRTHSRHFHHSILRSAFLFVDCYKIATLQQVDFDKLIIDTKASTLASKYLTV